MKIKFAVRLEKSQTVANFSDTLSPTVATLQGAWAGAPNTGHSYIWQPDQQPKALSSPLPTQPVPHRVLTAPSERCQITDQGGDPYFPSWSLLQKGSENSLGLSRQQTSSFREKNALQKIFLASKANNIFIKLMIKRQSCEGADHLGRGTIKRHQTKNGNRTQQGRMEMQQRRREPHWKFPSK